MKNELHFYVDDSGSRNPDRSSKAQKHEPNWYALGGVLVSAADAKVAKGVIQEFRNEWPQLKHHPFRSYDIRNKTANFRWLADLSASRLEAFYSGLNRMLISLPVSVMACVVDRPGYNRRYQNTYGQNRWKLCKTAFNIAVERAAKYASFQDSKLRVFVERSDRKTEQQLNDYYNELRSSGLPFDPGRSAKYMPFTGEQLRHTLYEFKVKTKESDLMQIADLVLWPVCKGGYEATYRSFVVLKENGKLLDSYCQPERGIFGIKYSCFDALQEPAESVDGRAEIQKPA